jgi:hypothetical protein
VEDETFDIFSGAPDENGLWVEAIGGLSNARQRMKQIATEKPGKYFLFSGSSQSILTRIETRSQTHLRDVGSNQERDLGFSL